MKKIAIYLRLSRADGDMGKDDKDESNSIENQRQLLRSFVEKQTDLFGEIVEYADDGYSGTNFDRPGFRKMVEDAKSGEIGTILVKDLSRLGRDYIGVGDYLEQVFPVLEIRFIAVLSNYDSDKFIGTTMGLEMSVSNLVNSLYCKDISKKYRTAVESKWKRGISTTGRVPFGYMRKEDGSWEPDPETSGYVRLIFEKAMCRWTTKMIANHLNEMNVPPPGQFLKRTLNSEVGLRRVTDEEWIWDGRKVWVILRNYAYTGAMVHGKTRAVHVGSKVRRNVGEQDRFILENHHPAIVSKKEFYEAAEAIAYHGKAGFRNDAGFSLKGKVRCGNCNLLMAYDGNATPVVYCSHAVESGNKSKCDRTRHSALKIEGAVWYALRQQLRLLREAEVKAQAKKQQVGNPISENKHKLEKKLEILKAERIRQYEAYAENIITKEVHLKSKAELAAEIDRITAICTQAQEMLHTENELAEQISKTCDSADALGVDANMTREIAEAFVDTVYIYDDERIEVKFLFDNLLARTMNESEKKAD